MDIPAELQAHAVERSPVKAAVESCLNYGWSRLEIPLTGNDPALLADLFQIVGVLRRSRLVRRATVDTLIPTRSGEARAMSLSARFGTGELPMHVDGAHLLLPPRLLVLYCVANTEDRPTRLLPWDRLSAALPNSQRLQREVFCYRSGRRSFLDSIASWDRAFIRFDPGCMAAATRGARGLLHDVEERLRSLSADEIHLAAGSAIVIDNWRVLHGRGLAQREGERMLFRLQFDIHPSEQ